MLCCQENGGRRLDSGMNEWMKERLQREKGKERKKENINELNKQAEN